MPHKYTDADDALIRELYPTVPTEQLAATIGVPATAVCCRAQRLGVSKPRLNTWTAAEDDIIREHYSAMTAKQLTALLPTRTVHAVTNRVQDLGLTTQAQRRWTTEEDALLRDKYATTRASKLAKQLGRTRAAVVSHANDLGLTKTLEMRRTLTGGEGRGWTARDKEALRRWFPVHQTRFIAAWLKRSFDAVSRMAGNMGLSKAPGFVVDRFMRNPVPPKPAFVMPRKTKGERPDTWTAQQDQLLRDLYPFLANSQVAKRLERSEKAVMGRAQVLGLRKAEPAARTRPIPNRRYDVGYLNRGNGVNNHKPQDTQRDRRQASQVADRVPVQRYDPKYDKYYTAWVKPGSLSR
ncbi:hypothetical protein GCM10027048_28030 [Hymenobacter coalescens]